MKKVLVAGAGASGIFAAGIAAHNGAQVHLFEKMKSPARKLLISGKGRCNLTNSSPLHDFFAHYNKNGQFLRQAFSQFFVPELITFFSSLGVELVTERGNRVFPKSGDSREIVTALEKWMKQKGVKLHTNCAVKEILEKDNAVHGVRTAKGIFEGDAVIVSTGGSTYPKTGSTGDGYHLAKQLGHSIIPLRPALVPLFTDSPCFEDLAGFDLKNIGLRVYVNKKKKISEFGEVSFNSSGIGGPLILKHSLFIVDALRRGDIVEISLDLKPALDDQKLDKRLQRDFQKRYNDDLRSCLRGILPYPLINIALQSCNLDANSMSGNVSSKERKRLLSWLKNYRFNITGHRPLKEGIVTAGGISVKEVYPKTMESKILSNVYFTGELLDIHGDTGGYNLQAAFSTGWIAGCSSAQ